MTMTMYISTGELNCFFTLRETYNHSYVIDGERVTEQRSYHIKNLSQNPHEAVEKANAAATAAGMDQVTTVDQLQKELARIRRATADELEARAKATEAREAKWAEERKARDEELIAIIKTGVFAIGNYKDQAFDEAPRSYLSWLITTLPEFEAGSVMWATANEVATRMPEAQLPVPTAGVYTGVIGKRQDFAVTIVACFHFYRECFSGYGSEVVHITKMIEKETGALLTVMSAAFNHGGEEGRELTLRATPKEHSEYKGEAQTVIQRVKEV